MHRRIRYVEDQLSTMSLELSVNYVSGLNRAGRAGSPCRPRRERALAAVNAVRADAKAAGPAGPPEGVPGMGDYLEVRVLYGPW